MSRPPVCPMPPKTTPRAWDTMMPSSQRMCEKETRRPRLPGGASSAIIARETGKSAPTARPSRITPTYSEAGPAATVITRAPTVYSPMVARNTRRRPYRSPSRPPISAPTAIMKVSRAEYWPSWASVMPSGSMYSVRAVPVVMIAAASR